MSVFDVAMGAALVFGWALLWAMGARADRKSAAAKRHLSEAAAAHEELKRLRAHSERIRDPRVEPMHIVIDELPIVRHTMTVDVFTAADRRRQARMVAAIDRANVRRPMPANAMDGLTARLHGLPDWAGELIRRDVLIPATIK